MVDHFRLQAVLKHRKHLEESAQKALAEANRKWAQALDGLERIKRERRRYRHDLRQKMRMTGDAAEVLLYMRYLRRLDGRIESQSAVVNALATEKTAKHTQLLAAVKNRKVIEKFEERSRAAEARQSLRREQIRLNEAAVNRFHTQSCGKDTP